MAAVQRASSVSCKFLLLGVLEALPAFTEIHCTSQQGCTQEGTSWTSLWLILLTVFLLLMCGIGASCVKFCCRKKRPPVQTFPSHAHDLTIIPMDHDSTAHSTVTSYSSLQYPQSLPLPLPFREVNRNMASPPAYSLYAIELPPSYDEAIKMAKPCIETPFAGQKLDNGTSEPAACERQSQPQTSSEESSNDNPEAVQEDSVVPEASTQEQPQL
ncbi:transmembrane protein 52 isoform X2 [Rhineura floridana]|uniref:transmembrane protein 52 isoform X2 n=1 Tax=Rhineura floridana TaxID=261503 RepID=UPI002AC80A6D|nr:transmembrane protein 52 isoform X2 [Rhineura floridana]